jgi:lysophospholipase L1-like esterase
MSGGVKARRAVAALAAALGLAAALPAAGQATLTTGVKIMPLGDSITYGYEAPDRSDCTLNRGGYRTGLYNRLVAAGITPNFVGTLSQGPSTLADRDNEGHCGWTIEQIQAQINSYMTADDPDVVLLHLGTNDMWRSATEAVGAPAAMSTLIDTIVADRPGVKIYLASITPSTDATNQARIVTYDQALQGIVNAKAAAGDDIHYVDMYDAINQTQLSDSLHPTDAGYDAMAQAWYDALTTTTNPNILLGGGFEDQRNTTMSAPWVTQTSLAGGPGTFGNDRLTAGKSRTGTANGWIATTGSEWDALTQPITVRAGTNYRMTVWLRNSGNFTGGWLGVKRTNGTVVREIGYGAQTAGYGQYTVDFSSGTDTTLVAHIGYWGPGAASWEQIDDVSIRQL